MLVGHLRQRHGHLKTDEGDIDCFSVYEKLSIPIPRLLKLFRLKCHPDIVQSSLLKPFSHSFGLFVVGLSPKPCGKSLNSRCLPGRNPSICRHSRNRNLGFWKSCLHTPSTASLLLS